MTAPEVQLAASLIAAATALLAVMVGPFISFRASKRQMLGPMRQAWINNLREAVAEYTAKIRLGMPQPSALLTPDDALRHQAQSERAAHLQSIIQLNSQISLLINPKEADHTELVRLARVALNDYENGQDASVQLQALIAHTQQVLKREWNVVKA